MASTTKDPVLVVLQLSGANDYLNCLVPYTNGIYYDNRPNVRIKPEEVIPLDDTLGFHPNMGPMKRFWDDGNLAIINGIGFENSPRSHFRAMDIWHTCEPDKIGTEGWLGRAVRDLDPNHDNVVKAVNFGQGLPRALSLSGVPVASVSDLESYGVLTGIAQDQRAQALERFARMYSPAIGRGAVMDYLGNTGLDALKGADVLKVAPQQYSSNVEYAATPIARALKGVAMTHLANVGTQVFYCQHGSFDTHATELPVHAKLWTEVSDAVESFFDDLREHNAADNVLMIMFTEFGRRVRDNGTGTDHGAAGVAFALGDSVKGGYYNEYPSLEAGELIQGDLKPNYDFRGFYATALEQWMGLDSKNIVGGTYEQLDIV